MRIPFKTESDAFRIAAALGLLAGLALLVGALATRAYGIVLFAAGLVAGVVFELSGRETDGRSGLREAAHAPHPHGAVATERHVVVVAGVALAGNSLAAELRAIVGERGEIDVLAPIQASRSHHWASDVDRERDEASARLAASLAWAETHGFTARGKVGDADPLMALEDELRDFGADEVVVVAHPQERTSWLADRLLAHLSRELDIPVRQVVAGDDENHIRDPAPG